MTRRRSAGIGVALACVTCVAITAHNLWAQGPPPAARVGWRVIELSTGRVLDTQDPDLLSRPVLPGSLVKVPALIALLERGAITPGTRIDCPGAIVVDGRRIGCDHPRRAHPLSAVEAVALSCNVFFARASERLTRDAFNDVLASFGWPAVPSGRALAVAVSGVEGYARAARPAPLRLAAGARRSAGVPMRSPTRKVVTDALAAAAHDGTAAVFRTRGVDALAKTGTSVMADGHSTGLVLAAWPASRPARAVLVVVDGGTGPDAAAVAATLATGERPVVRPPPACTPDHGSPASATAPPTSMPERGTPAAPAPPVARDQGDVVTIRVGTPQPGGAYSVRVLPLEEYVERVLAGEAAPRTAPAALEALAITVRTFALANRRRHARDGFDLCDSTHCQVLREVYAATRAASDATAGQVLAWRGAPASVFYTASCGGRTERPSAVWPGAMVRPSCRPVATAAAAANPSGIPRSRTPNLARALTAAGYRGAQLRKVKVTDRAESGRVAVLSLEGLTPNRIRPGPANGDRADAWVAAAQEHRLRFLPPPRCLPVHRARVRSWRRIVRDRLDEACRGRGVPHVSPEGLLPRSASGGLPHPAPAPRSCDSLGPAAPAAGGRQGRNTLAPRRFAL